MATGPGQPLKFKSVKELQKKIDAYFKEMKKEERPYTITGLALALGTSRETLINYENRKKYFDTIKTAKLKCHNFAEEQLFVGKNATGSIFNLKNNYGWKDKTETELSGSLDIGQPLTEEEEAFLNEHFQGRSNKGKKA